MLTLGPLRADPWAEPQPVTRYNRHWTLPFRDSRSRARLSSGGGRCQGLAAGLNGGLRGLDRRGVDGGRASDPAVRVSGLSGLDYGAEARDLAGLRDKTASRFHGVRLWMGTARS